MYVYIYVWVCVYIDIFMYMHTRILSQRGLQFMYIYNYVFIYIYIHVYICTNTHTHTHMHSHLGPSLKETCHSYLYTHTYIYIYIYTNTYIDICIYIHTYIRGIFFKKYSQSHVGWNFRKLFQSSKLKDRTSLLLRFREKRRSSFELWALKEFSKMSPHVGAFENVTTRAILSGVLVIGTLYECVFAGHSFEFASMLFYMRISRKWTRHMYWYRVTTMHIHTFI